MGIKLYQVTEEKVRDITHPTPITKLYGTHKTSSILDEPGSKSLVVQGALQRVVSEDQTTLVGLRNAAPGVADVESITLTVKKVDGDLEDLAVTQDRSVDLKEVVEVYADPLDAADSIVVLEEVSPERPGGALKTMRTVLTVDEDLATIAALV